MICWVPGFTCLSVWGWSSASPFGETRCFPAEGVSSSSPGAVRFLIGTPELAEPDKLAAPAEVQLTRECEQDKISTGGEPAGRVAAPLRRLHLLAGGHVPVTRAWPAKKGANGLRTKWLLGLNPHRWLNHRESRPSQPDTLRGRTAVFGRLRVGPSTKVGIEGTFFNPQGCEVSKSARLAWRLCSLTATGVRGEESLGNLTP